MAAAFDAYGDQASAGARTYGYDALGRLTSDQPTGSGTGYTFSYAGTTGTIASDGSSTYTWDPSGTVVTGIGAAGGGPPGALAFTDPHGDVLGQFTAAGTAMAGSQAFDPWGTVTATTGALLGGLGFQSAWNDPGTGKDLMGARWYSAATGGFTSADTVQVSPVPNPAAGNPFAYAGDDPLDAADPTGHCLKVSTGLAIANICVPQVTTPSKQATITLPANSDGKYQAGWGLNYLGEQGTGEGAGIMGALSQLMYQAWQQQLYKQQQASRPKPKKVSDASGSGGNATNGPIKSVTSGGSKDSGGSTAGPPAIPPWLPHHVPGPANPVLTPGPDESAILASVTATIAALSTSTLDSTGGLGNQLIQQASDEVAGWIQDYGPQILGTLAGIGVLAACEGLTAGAATPACSALGGATSGGLSYLLDAGQSGAATGGGLLSAALQGGAQWAAGGPLGDISAPAADTASSIGAAAEGTSLADAAAAPCGGMSFTAGTKVLLANGKKTPIGSLKPGDKVIATNTKTGKTSAEPVGVVLVHHDSDLYDLEVRSGHTTAVIDTTSSHLFWVPSAHRWVKAAALRHGTHLRTSDGTDATVVGGYVPRQHDGWMWDLTIPGDHDFYVFPATDVEQTTDGNRYGYDVKGEFTPVLVHNCNPVVDFNVPKIPGVYTVHTYAGDKYVGSATWSIRERVASILNPRHAFTRAGYTCEDICNITWIELPRGVSATTARRVEQTVMEGWKSQGFRLVNRRDPEIDISGMGSF